MRLTLLYGGLFLVAGTILLAITYTLVQNNGAVSGKRTVVLNGKAPSGKAAGAAAVYFTQTAGAVPPPTVLPGVPIQLRTTAGRLQAEAQAQVDRVRSDQRVALLTESGVALAITAVLSIGLGWLMAGRALRPMRAMSARARRISERNLHERLALTGPDDELKELADTFDGLLGRLETAFESQRRFVANASHELRTPITLERALVEVALADPNASMESMRDTCRRVLSASEQQERLIEALLTLARSQRGVASREELDLAEVAADASRGLDRDGVRLELALGAAPTSGDPRLLERLIANLIDNGLKYNDEHGWVRAWTGVRHGKPVVEVENSGPVVPAEDVAQLVEPFRRLNGERSENGEAPHGLGLGLSIVDAIAAAHDARLVAIPRAEGGLRVEVSFPPV